MECSFSRIFRFIKLTGLVVLSLLIVSLLSLVLWKQNDDKKLLGLYADKGQFVSFGDESLLKQVDPVTGWGSIILTDWEGNALPCRVTYPPGPVPERGYGCVIVNYGVGQRMTFFERLAPLFANRGVIMIMPEQYGRGDRRAKGEQNFFEKVYEPRERAARLVAETRMLVDYLCAQPEVDQDRIDYMGISYGGIVGTTLLAEEPRFRSGTFVMAGGNISMMLNGLLRHVYPDSKVLVPIVAKFGAWWMSAFEPLDHLGAVKMEKLLFLWVEPDELIPLSARQQLVATASVPVTEKTYPGPHSRPPVESVQQMIFDSLDWMGYALEEDNAERKDFGKPTASF